MRGHCEPRPGPSGPTGGSGGPAVPSQPNVSIRGDSDKSYGVQSKMMLVKGGLGPGGTRLVGLEVMPGLAAILGFEAPAGVVGLGHVGGRRIGGGGRGSHGGKDVEAGGDKAARVAPRRGRAPGMPRVDVVARCPSPVPRARCRITKARARAMRATRAHATRPTRL